jgi:hypothetical protein
MTDEDGSQRASAGKPVQEAASGPRGAAGNLAQKAGSGPPAAAGNPVQEAASTPLNATANPPEMLPFAEELGIEDLSCPVFGSRGRLFSAAGPKSPIAEFTEDALVLHPPQKPYDNTGPAENIVIRVSEQGVLLDELGQPKQIIGAKFRGRSLWFSGEQKEGTLKHFVIWFDKNNDPHKLYALRPRPDGTSTLEALTSETIFKLRNRTHDGELSVFPDLQTD